MTTLSKHDPDRTLPMGSRVYGVPSCGACLRIARKHGVNVGDLVYVQGQPGAIEGFTHADDGVQAVVMLDNGFLVSTAAERLYNDRDFVVVAPIYTEPTTGFEIVG
jgi:hypothetical protein